MANQYIAVMNDKNIGILDEIFHPNFQVTEQLETPSLRYERKKAGIAEIKKILNGYFIAFPDIHLNIVDTIASETSAVVYWIAKMTHLGDFFGLKATNKNLEAEGFYYFKIKDDKIIDYNLTYDTLKVFSEIGHAIIEEGDEGAISEYLKALLEQNFVKESKN